MNNYNHFARIYNRLYDSFDYQVRSDYISGFFDENNISEGTILDLACGTCAMSEAFAKKGYRIIGVDYSPEMLEIASNRLLGFTNNFSLLLSKMQDFNLSERVDACICCFDSINHLNSIDDVKSTFDCVYNSLKQNGLFIFDVNTIYKHNTVLCNNTFIDDEDEFYLAWDNELIDDRNVRIILDIFENNNDVYTRYNEDFVETAYTVEEITKALINAGFVDIQVYNELTKDAPQDNSERLFFICKRK